MVCVNAGNTIIQLECIDKQMEFKRIKEFWEAK